MPKRILTALFVGLLGLATNPSAQTTSAVPRTPWGHPDLQGRWTNATVTLLERPIEFGAKEYFTEAEAAEYGKTALERLLNAINFREEAALSGEFEPGVWVEERSIVPTRRTSLVVGPTGRLPPLAPAAQDRAKARAARQKEDPTDGPEARGLPERCLWFTVGGPPMMPSVGYNSNYEIVQTPTHLVILAEMGSAVRIIPLDGRPHLSERTRQWQGDSRGRFEGDTLIVETVNFNGKAQYRGSSENLRLLEKFRRTDRDMILYEVTVSDPTTWTASWTAEVPMRRLAELIYEFACHEGNRGLANILSAARWSERRTVDSR